MDDVNNEIVDVDKFQDDSAHELTSGETQINPTETPISDEPIEVLVAQESPIIHEDTSELHHAEKEQIIEEVDQHHNVDPTGKFSMEDGKSLDGFIDSGHEIEDATSSKPVVVDKEAIDTSKPIESVKNAASKFGGIVARKAKTQTDEKSRIVESEEGKEGNEGEEEAKRKASKELESFNRQIEELKLNLERAHEEESRAIQDSELAKMKVMEMEDQATVDNEQLEDERIVSELKSVKEIEDLQQKHASLTKVKEIEKNVKEMKFEVGSAQAAFVEAEEKRNEAAMAKEQEKLVWDKEMGNAKEEMEILNQEVEVVKDLKGKLNAATEMLESFKFELSGYNESTNDEMKTELEGLKLKTEKLRDHTKSLKVASVMLNKELEHERSELKSAKQREGDASAEIAILEEEMEKVKSEINAVHSRMKELPMQLEVASQEADDAMSAAESARTRLIKVKEEVEQVSILERRVLSVQEEIEKTKASEKLAMEEYNELSKRDQEVKEDESVILRKLEEANQELVTRKEVYAHAINKAEKENKERLMVEQELRKWSDENEQRQEDNDGTKGILEGQDFDATHEQGEDSKTVINNNESAGGSDSSKMNSPRQQEQATSHDTSANTKHGKKKKKHFFPHLLMLFSKKKASSHTT